MLDSASGQVRPSKYLVKRRWARRWSRDWRAAETLPRALFVLIPALALILGLFYRRRHYPEHLYFALHFQAFVFVGLMFAQVAQYSGSLLLLGAAQMAATLWILAYGVVAQRRVYGGSWPVTVLKAFGVAALFGTLWSVTTLVVTLWASRSG
jgi:hypothetical protein